MVLRLVGPSNDLDAASSMSESESARWTCSFVNNMPDSAFEATERQFLELLSLASGDDVIQVRRHTMTGIARDTSISKYVGQNYVPLGDVKHMPPDMLIVTGSNPIEVEIEAELYWDEMTDLLSWGSKNVSSMLLSCLAAHAALSIFDGVRRVRLDQKCSGVFAQSVVESHFLGVGLGAEVLLPHSRMNTALTASVREHGYVIAIESDEVGWSVATKTIGQSRVVLVQAHPEYEPTSLLREYRRDARRFVTGERVGSPVLPYHCVADVDWDRLRSLQDTLTPTQEGAALLDDYPFEDVGARVPWLWHDVAKKFYANWLASVRTEKGDNDA
jgi:homoserine O-succinyltransferase